MLVIHVIEQLRSEGLSESQILNLTVAEFTAAAQRRENQTAVNQENLEA